MIFHAPADDAGGGGGDEGAGEEETSAGLFDRDMLRSALLGSTETRAKPKAEVEEEEKEETEEEEEAEAEETEEAPVEGAETEAAEEEVEPAANPEAAKLQQRIDTLTAQLTAAKAERTPVRAGALDDAETEAELDEAIATARAAKDWALEHLEGGETPAGADGKPGQFLDSKAVGRILGNAEKVLEAAPARRENLRAIAQQEANGRQIYPDAYKDGTPGAKFREEVLRQVPKEVQRALRRWRGDWETIVFDASLVGRLRQDRPQDWADQMGALLASAKPKQGGAKTPPGKTPVPAGSKPTPPTPGGRQAPKVPEKQLAARRAAEALRKTNGRGSERHLTAAVLARFS